MPKTNKAPTGGKRSRFFSLTTYAIEKQIHKVVSAHINSIRALCYILHDKDEAEPHYHILMRTHSNWTTAQISKWFADLKDKEKKPVNTFCETANDMDALKKYIIHDTPECREEGKYQYSPDDIKDFGMCDLAERKDCYDSSYEILLKVLAGANPRELVRYYGRDYLYHLNAYHDCADKIRELEGYREASMFARMNMFEEKNLKKVEDIDDL
ncbi:MAG: hypothetical protein IJW55_09445 [Clostridia bacterium]|nr:hypothetical protein [Clostridia bacterium]